MLQELGFHKYAKVSVKKLRSMLDGEAPLFHMVHPSNQESFLKTKKILSPFEAKARGLLQTTEGSWGTHRADATIFEPSLPHQVGKNAVRIRGRELVKDYGLAATDTAEHFVRMGKQEIPELGAVNTAKRMLSSSNAADAGKNWGTISTTTSKPARGYGDVGLMSNPKKVRGRIAGDDIDQYISPQRAIRGGLLHHITLPEMRGTPIYDPTKVSRDVAKQLKAEGAVAINSRLKRKLSGYKKTLPPDSLPYTDTSTDEYSKIYDMSFNNSLTDKQQRLADKALPFFEEHRRKRKAG